MRAKRALDLLPVDDLGSRPAFRGAQHEHRPGGRAIAALAVAGGPLDALDLLDDLVEHLGHAPVRGFGLVALDEQG